MYIFKTIFLCFLGNPVPGVALDLLQLGQPVPQPPHSPLLALPLQHPHLKQVQPCQEHFQEGALAFRLPLIEGGQPRPALRAPIHHHAAEGRPYPRLQKGPQWPKLVQCPLPALLLGHGSAFLHQLQLQGVLLCVLPHELLEGPVALPPEVGHREAGGPDGLVHHLPALTDHAGEERVPQGQLQLPPGERQPGPAGRGSQTLQCLEWGTAKVQPR